LQALQDAYQHELAPADDYFTCRRSLTDAIGELEALLLGQDRGEEARKYWA
jgi:hypothetical protein